MDHRAGCHLKTMESVPPFLSAIFGCLSSLMRSPSRKLGLLLSENLSPEGPAAVAAEGVLGMFLAAAHEYESVLFRSLKLEGDFDLEKALAGAVDTGTTPIGAHRSRP